MESPAIPTERSRPSDGIVERPDGLRHLTPDRAGAFLGLVRAGDAVARDLDADLRRQHDLSLHAFEVLLFLAVFASGGEMALGELTRQAPLSQSRVSRLVAELERRGLVERSEDPHDARSVNVTITAVGVDLFREAQDTHLEDLDRRLFSRLTEREIRQLATIAAKILDRGEPESSP